MKKILLFVAPLLVSIAIFFGILYFLDRQSNKGALQVTSDPKSQVYLNNKLVGETTFCACKSSEMIRVGDYSIKLIPKDSSFKPFEEQITINRSTVTGVDRTFSREGSSGTAVSLSKLSNKKDIEILAESIPSKANIFLDDNPVGITPLLLKNVSEGDHDVKARKGGFKDKLIKINTTLGYKVSIKLFLGLSDPASGKVYQSEKTASSSAILENKKVLILDTPTGFLRVREDSSVSSLEVGRVNPGEEYELLDEKEEWFEIKFDSPAGEEKKGWISAQYAKKE